MKSHGKRKRVESRIDPEPNTRLIVSELPPSCTESKLTDHFEQFGELTDVYIVRDKKGKSRCFGFIGFSELDAATEAQKRANRTFLGSNRIRVQYVVEDLSRVEKTNQKLKTDQSDAASSSIAMQSHLSDLDYVKMKQAGAKLETEDHANTKVEGPVRHRLLVSNMPATFDEDNAHSYFGAFDGFIGCRALPGGKVFVEFSDENTKHVAENELRVKVFRGKRLKVREAQETMDSNTSRIESQPTSFKHVKELERRRKAMSSVGWNSSYIRSDTVVDTFAERLGVGKADLMGTEASSGDMAVRLALAETQLQAENSQYFLNHGVDIKALEGAQSKSKVARSENILLVKNLPTSSDTSELSTMFSSFGSVTQVLLPPSKSLCLVEFFDSKDATRALKGLAYKRYQNMPLYIEFAPLASKPHSQPTPQTEEISEEITPDDSDQPAATIFIKNLNFSTTESSLRRFLEKTCKIRSLSLPKHSVANGKEPKTKGFAFVEVAPGIDIDKLVNRLDGSMLEGHKLTVEKSRTKPGQSQAEDKGTKLCVRNIAFQASMQEVRQLFSAFGQLKSVRIPKRMGGKHRGFAFVEFLSPHEAAGAYEKLSATHFYGRHLVIEWAAE